MSPSKRIPGKWLPHGWAIARAFGRLHHVISFMGRDFFTQTLKLTSRSSPLAAQRASSSCSEAVKHYHGRVLAKQESFAAVALVLLSFHIDVLGFMNEQGKRTGNFPKIRNSYSESGIMVTDCDMIVRIRRKTRRGFESVG